MENYSIQSSDLKRRTAIRALVIEILIVAILFGVIVFLLNYFNVIQFDNLFKGENSNSVTANPNSDIQRVTPEPFKPIEDQRVSSDILQRYLYISTNSAATKLILHSVYEGKITDMNNIGGYDNRIHIQFVLFLRMKGKGAIESEIYFSNEDMKKTKVVQKQGDEEVPLDYLELKVGDNIIVDIVEDKSKPTYNSVDSAKITRL